MMGARELRRRAPYSIMEIGERAPIDASGLKKRPKYDFEEAISVLIDRQPKHWMLLFIRSLTKISAEWMLRQDNSAFVSA